ncbi:MAG: hypothetical protein AB1651_18325 [Pseudomonadota bacterium]
MSARGVAWAQALIAVAIVALVVAVGYRQGRVAERAVWQTREIAAQQAARERWAAAEAEREAASRRALAVGERLAEAQDAIETARRRTRDALRDATAGRACLSARAVGLLNDQRAGGRLSAVPDAADRRPPAPDPAAAAPDTAHATDTDVAEWISGAIASYDACRAQVACWVAWYDGTPQRCELGEP